MVVVEAQPASCARDKPAGPGYRPRRGTSGDPNRRRAGLAGGPDDHDIRRREALEIGPPQYRDGWRPFDRQDGAVVLETPRCAVQEALRRENDLVDAETVFARLNANALG